MKVFLLSLIRGSMQNVLVIQYVTSQYYVTVSSCIVFYFHGMQVYEHITYDNERHVSLASLPGMQKRTIITSSLSKTFSVTGNFYTQALFLKALMLES